MLLLLSLLSSLPYGGEGGIRTHETLTGLRAFEARAIDQLCHLTIRQRTAADEGQLRQATAYGTNSPAMYG